MSAPDEDPPARRTLLIGSETLLEAWSEHAGGGANHVVVVAHTDLTRALRIIEQTQPDAVIVEQSLAATESGRELMERLHNERKLRGLEISLLPADGVDRLLTMGPGDAHPYRWLTSLARPLPPRPVRGAPRMRADHEEHVLVDGQPATLLDLSATGAQVRSSGALRPNQHVRVVLSARGSMKTPGVVVWSMLEGKPPLRYRAGIAFAFPIPELAKGSEDVGKTESKTPSPKKAQAPRRSRKAR